MTLASLRTHLSRGLLGLTSASLLFTTTLTPLAAQWAPPGMAQGARGGPVAGVYSPEELESILAPVALYPDQLLTQMLMAASFPDEVAAAARWAQLNRGLRGEALDRALRPIPWDPAVKSLVSFPQALEMLAEHPQWMAQLDFAMAVQQADTLDAIQDLRRRAWQAGTLRTGSQLLVRMDANLIIIEPRQAGLVYVPVYNPVVIYGAWPYPSYPPHYFPPRYAVPGNVLASGIFFGVGVLTIGALWGWATPRWNERYFQVDRNRFEYFRHFHSAPRGDWGRWEQDRWRPPQRDGRAPPRSPQWRQDGERGGPGLQRPGDGRPGIGRPGDGRPGDGRPGDGRPGDGRPGDGQVRPMPQRPQDGQPGRAPEQPRDWQGRPGPQRPAVEAPRPTPPQPGAVQPGPAPQRPAFVPARPNPGDGRPGPAAARPDPRPEGARPAHGPGDRAGDRDGRRPPQSERRGRD